MFSSLVQQLPPTIGIEDPATRQVLDAVVNLLDLRSGNTDKSSEERFITVGDLRSAFSGTANLDAGSVTNVFGGGGSLIPIVDGLVENVSNEVITQLLQNPINLIDVGPIRNRINEALQQSREYTELGITEITEELTTATESLTTQIEIANSRIDNTQALIVSERSTRATADQALSSSLSILSARVGTTESAIIAEASARATADDAATAQFNALIARVASAEAAISTENSTRTNRDNALASAINTIWSQIGGSSAVIKDGALAAVSPSGVTADKWTQLQSAVLDPLTGQYISSAAIRTDARTAISATNQLSASYTVKVDLSGYVTGFGLAASSNNGVPTSSFQVRADRFSIVNPSGNRSTTVMTNNTIKVYDESGVLRVQIGNLNV